MDIRKQIIQWRRMEIPEHIILQKILDDPRLKNQYREQYPYTDFTKWDETILRIKNLLTHEREEIRAYSALELGNAREKLALYALEKCVDRDYSEKPEVKKQCFIALDKIEPYYTYNLYDPATIDNEDFITEAKYLEWLDSTYMDKNTGLYLQDTTKYNTANRQDIPPLGSWLILDDPGDHGHYIEELREIKLEHLVKGEDTHPDKWENIEQYMEWMKKGKIPPPIHAIELGYQKFQIVDGHRRWLASRQLDKPTILAWIAPKIRTEELNWENNHVYVFMTKELLPHKEKKKRPELFWPTPKTAQNQKQSPTLNQKEDWINKSIEYFGLTDHPVLGGYILPDGSMLDFSGRRDTSDYKRIGDRYYIKKGRDWLNDRSTDHREISEVVGITRENWLDFMRITGAIRMSHQRDAIFIMFSNEPTPEQIKTLKSFIKQPDTYLAIDILDQPHKNEETSYEFDSAKKTDFEKVIYKHF